MKVSVTFLLLTASAFLSVVSAEVFVVLTTPEPLSPNEATAVEGAIGELLIAEDEEPNNGVRLLRSQQEDRSLGSFQHYKCNKWCAGWPPCQCYLYKRECKYNVRRELLQDTSTNAVEQPLEPQQRQLGLVSPETNAECQVKISQALEAIESAVSNETLPIVDASDFTCYQECKVNGFALWNTRCNTLTRENIKDGALICQNDYEFAIQALVEDCVSWVRFELTGPNGFSFINTEISAPLFNFGNENHDIHGASENGLTLPAGSYSLTATPDGDADLAETVRFHLIQC